MEYPQEERGRCRTCGFLARLRYSTPFSSPRYVEAGEEDRATGELYSQHDADGRPVRAEIACYRRAFALNQEVGQEFQRPGGATLPEAVLAVIGKDRRCPFWIAYTPDFGPKEHLEEFRVNEVQKMVQRTQRLQLLVGVGQVLFSAVAIATAVVLAVIFTRDGDTIVVTQPIAVVQTVASTDVTPQPERTGEAEQETPAYGPDAR